MNGPLEKKKTNVLVIGSGGREHAIAWKARQSKIVENVYVAPGNGGTKDFNLPIGATEISKLRDFATDKKCLTIVGPEGPLAAGIVDQFQEVGLPIFGPTKEQAMLESSKSYAKNFMKHHGIPTAEFKAFEEGEPALDYATQKKGQVVVKADGLAAGKGVFVCASIEEAESAIEQILDRKTFGRAGDKVVVEEKLSGKEASYMFLSDGKTALNFGTAVDHKKAFDGDKGPNTGGMGAFSPAPDLTREESKLIIDKIVVPTVQSSGFRGFLYVGLMFDESNHPRVLEFNSRLGDPEAQAILPRLESDLVELLFNEGNRGGFGEGDIKWNSNHSCTVVMCSEGYPENPKTGDLIKGIPEAESFPDVIVFHSGTAAKENALYTNGGRVLSVTGLGPSRSVASEKAYLAVNSISWRGERHRTDIS